MVLLVIYFEHFDCCGVTAGDRSLELTVFVTLVTIGEVGARGFIFSTKTLLFDNG
jgi:hypothetical protein